ncbi:MAG: response regulator [Polyangiaceae bacterium]|nr:response regulator [Polyangiaceae bacterium]
MSSANVGPYRTILLVDDSEVTCESVRIALEQSGFEVQTLNSPFGFIRSLRQHQPVVILLDVGLGSVNGAKLVPLGRQHAPPNAKILLFSGRDDEELERDVLESGADGYINKRNGESRLVLEIKKWAARGQ